MIKMNENTTTVEDFRDETLALWEIIILSVIFFITITGNCLIFLALYLRRYRGRQRKLTRMFFFIMHLSIADLITGLFNVLPQLAWDITFRFQGGFILCKLVKFLQPLGNYLSSYILTATAIDRYHAICHPFSYCRKSSLQSRFMVYSAWCLSFVLCIPQTIIFSYQEISVGVWDCWASFQLPHGERIYVTWYSFTVFLIPFVVLLFTYISILIEIKKNTEKTSFENNYKTNNLQKINLNKNQPLISKAKIKTIKQMVIVVSFYVITSSPFIGCQLWATWDSAATDNSSFLTGPTFTILSLMSSLTSCVNPWIYLAFNQELRLIVIKFFKRYIFFQKNFKNFEREVSCESSNIPSSTRTSFVGIMFRCAGSIIYRNPFHDRTTDFTIDKMSLISASIHPKRRSLLCAICIPTFMLDLDDEPDNKYLC
ncbi:mesotocin receptor-like isoform X1 [Chelonus insularis]|uniref:mesotocin receptor-like isoform X1 n=1 Tax=Chelonus insularis TaxID=460826 RepID=UPI00158D9A2B|nr:mesotocin receptor-like isoform X1 [Chelonus insularis]XP_034942503.1 mesotocin receptor-like isoform X1 [Chelonus insularis]